MSVTPLYQLPSQLRAMRERAGLTLKEVSDEAGISLSYLSDLERGRTLPSLETLQSIANVYGTGGLYIAFGDAGLEYLFNRVKELEEKLAAIRDFVNRETDIEGVTK